jgi:excisionase family DNA binding protein
MRAIKIPIEHVARIADDVADNATLDVDLAAARLGTDRDTLLAWVAEEIIPYTRVGTTIVFRTSDILRWRLRGLSAICKSPRRPSR